MKKTFKLQVENKNTDRVVDSIKHEIRKYIKREQNKPFPEEMNYWYFECKFGKDSETPTEIPYSQLIRSVDEAAEAKCETFYLEIVSIAKKREKKVREIVQEDNENTTTEETNETTIESDSEVKED